MTSASSTPVARARTARASSTEIGSTADHFDFREDDDDYFTQPGDLFRLLTAEEQQRLFDNTARAIKGARPQTVEKHIENCTQADPAYGEGVREACKATGAL
ncbi:catalase-related domain-containing protein [Microbispora rosea]|uniref:catalase-related domain-containing protein n=1 Tax=Microbispora rosea TaxID=58117 RepID=UPI003447C7BD